MSDPYTAAFMVAASAYQQRHQPATPPPPAPVPPPPQAAKSPNIQAILDAVRGTGQAKGAAGYAQTFLSGTQGVDPNALTLSKPTLLGS